MPRKEAREMWCAQRFSLRIKAAKCGVISSRQLVGGESTRTGVEEVMSALVVY